MRAACNIQNDSDTERRRLLNTDKQFAAMSLTQGAAEAFRHYLTEDALGLPQDQLPTIGRASIYASMCQEQENYSLAWEPQRAEVSHSEDMGWTWGTYELSSVDVHGKPQKQYGKYVNIWERQNDGQWRVIVDMGNTSPVPEKKS